MKNTPMQKENSINGQGAKDYWCRKKEFFYIYNSNLQVTRTDNSTIQKWKIVNTITKQDSNLEVFCLFVSQQGLYTWRTHKHK